MVKDPIGFSVPTTAPAEATSTATPTAVSMLPARERLASIDILRGLVMVIMALDHVRDFFTNVPFDPLDLSQTTIALAFTRWITHFCAPVFVFLAGTGAFLALGRGRTRRDLAWFLLTRGLWLVLLEVTLVRVGWLFDLNYVLVVGQVIWAIGWSMVVLAGLVFLPVGLATFFGVLMIATHNLLDPVQAASFGSLAWLWDVLHVPARLEFAPGHVFLTMYPLIPWIGVMAAGYGFGTVFQMEQRQRRKTLYLIGGGLTAAFIIIRALNLYGDPHPWAVQGSFAFTVISFLNCTKYPPSLLYLLMTLGPAIAVLPLLERWKGAGAGFFMTFGRVPLFYYILHVPYAHALAVVAALLTVHDASIVLSPNPATRLAVGYGFSLPVVYLVWAFVVLTLYPLCRWFAGVKRRSRSSILSYF